MNGLLVRVGIDQSEGGGQWNGPCDLATKCFVYVPISEERENKEGLATPYSIVQPALKRLNSILPDRLAKGLMHLDPDFQYLTYGDRKSKGQQLVNLIHSGDLLIFYSGLRDIRSQDLVYAFIGLYVVDHLERAFDIPKKDAHRNAHTRRILSDLSDDIVVFAKPGESGRLFHYIPIGEYRDRSYRVRPELLKEWGGLNIKNGYLQRSANFPQLLDLDKFQQWWRDQNPKLVACNNPD